MGMRRAKNFCSNLSTAENYRGLEAAIDKERHSRVTQVLQTEINRVLEGIIRDHAIIKEKSSRRKNSMQEVVNINFGSYLEALKRHSEHYLPYWHKALASKNDFACCTDKPGPQGIDAAKDGFFEVKRYYSVNGNEAK